MISTITLSTMKSTRFRPTFSSLYRTLGPGFEEVIYQRALARELPAHDLEFSREVWIDMQYKGEKVGRKRVDFIVDEVMVAGQEVWCPQSE